MPSAQSWTGRESHFDSNTNTRYHIIEDLERRLADAEKLNPPPGNTTLTVIITNQKIETAALKQFARQVHASMARAIQPFQTKDDGDILYAITTDEVENHNLNETALGVIASEVVWDAVLSIVDTGWRDLVINGIIKKAPQSIATIPKEALKWRQSRINE